MCAARTVLSQRSLRYSILGAAASIGLQRHIYKSQPISNDSPVAAQWPRDHDLVAQGHRSVAQRSLGHPSSHKHAGADPVVAKDESEIYVPAFENDDESAWASFSNDLNVFRETLAGLDWGNVGNKITDFILPAWARLLPDQVRKLQFELSMEPGTLAHEIWQEAADADINPEIMWDASVRISNNLCEGELSFQKKAKGTFSPGVGAVLEHPRKRYRP